MNEEIINRIQELRKNGKSYGEIAKSLLITKSQACYFSKVDLGNIIKRKIENENRERDICDLARKCDNVNQICKILGKKATNENYKYILRILKKNNINISHFTSTGINDTDRKKRKINECLVTGSTIGSSKLREKLIEEGLKEHKCERCGRAEWEGEKIPLQLHHINGDRADNRIDNLQLLCPNCHTLTDNYCGKKLRKENRCLICGSPISKGARYCKECYDREINGIVEHKYRKYANGLEHPSREELLELFKNIGSFSGIGKKYGVSDKAVSRWFLIAGLPNKANDIKKYCGLA